MPSSRIKISSQAAKLLAGCTLLLCLLMTAQAIGQDAWPDYPQVDPNDPHTIDRGPGGYFAWWKLLMIALVFVMWVKMTDWMNQDTIKFQKQHGLAPQVWNPISIIAFLLGLFGIVINIPWFVLGFPLYVLFAFTPFLAYMLMRRGKVDPAKKDDEEGEALPDYDKMPVKIKPAGDSADHCQANLIRARQSPVYGEMVDMFYDYAFRRVEILMLDFTRESVARKLQIDGAWIDQEPLDRQTGDAMLASMKYLANLDPFDRRSRQSGQFDSKIRRLEIVNRLTTQGTPQGERAILKFEIEQEMSNDLRKLGMWEDEYSQLMSVLEEPGYTIVSAPPGQGLSTTWKALLHSVDRFVSDWVALIDINERETDIENIEPTRFDPNAGESPAQFLEKLLLKEPTGLVVPNPVDAKTLDRLTREIDMENRRVISRIQAKSAVEAVLRIMTLSKEHRSRYIQVVRAATCQKLVRRLCDSCKQPVQTTPQLIQQLGGDPANPPVIYSHYQPPPPEQRVDERGKPIEIPVCKTCGGIGYIGRIGVFEVLFINDQIREAMEKSPKVETVTQAAVQSGHRNLAQQAYRLVLEGVTSIQEIQRVLKS